MKKTIFYLSLALMAMSCVKENAPVTNESEAQLVPMEFVTSVEATKTVLAEDGQSVLWIKGDKVAVFDGTSEKKTFEAETAGAVVTLKGDAAAADEYYATYPVYGTMTDGVFTASVSAQQNAKVGSMSNNCAVLAAKSEGNNFHFKNVSSLIKFNLAVEGVKSLTLMGNNNEQIAGKFTFTWNNGDPQITGITVPQVAVSVRNSNGNDLALGDYYFTVIPTNFEKGFSVILGMNDGTQQIVTRSAAVELKKNQIFRTQEVPASAYKAYSSNYVKYNDGFDFTFGDLVVNKATSGDATYICKDGSKISSDGVYFISSNVNTLELACLGTKKLFVSSDNATARVSVSQTRAIQPQNPASETDLSYIVLSGLDIANGNNLNQFFLQQTADKGGFSKFGSIVVDNCKFNAVTQLFLTAIYHAMSIENLIIQNSDFILKNTTSDKPYVYIVNSNKECTIKNLVYHNNVFHNGLTGDASDKLTAFRLGNIEAVTVENLSVTNNTLSYVKLGTAGYVSVKSFTGIVEATGNFFVNSHTIDKMYLLKTANGPATMKYTVKDNFYFTDDWNKRFWAMSIPSGSAAEKVSSVNPAPLMKNPLASSWDPANDVFGYVDDLKYGSLNTNTTPYSVTEKGDVSTYRGAQRKTSAAVVNLAGYNYSSEELGNL